MRTHLNREHIGQTHSEVLYFPDFSVTLTNEDTGRTVKIVDTDGTICNFPGITPCEALTREINLEKLAPVVRYSTSFKKLENGHYRMIWTVRPDGSFWMDSWGFGAEDYDAVALHAEIDENGQFTGPFQLYK